MRSFSNSGLFSSSVKSKSPTGVAEITHGKERLNEDRMLDEWSPPAVGLLELCSDEIGVDVGISQHFECIRILQGRVSEERCSTHIPFPSDSVAVGAHRGALERGISLTIVDQPDRPMKTGSSNLKEPPYMKWHSTVFS